MAKISNKTLQDQIALKSSSQFKSNLNKLTRKSTENPAQMETNIPLLLARVGLQNATLVDSFFKTIAGKKTKKLLQDQMDLIITLRKNLEQHILDENFKRLHKKVMEYLKHLKEVRAERLNESIQRQIDKLIKQNTQKAKNDETESFTPPDMLMIQSQIYAAFALAAQVVERSLEVRVKEAEVLEAELSALEIEYHMIVRRYDIFDKHLQHLDSDSQQFIARKNEKAPAEQINEIRNVIASLSQSIAATQLQIDGFVEANRTQEAFELMHELHALSARTVGMQDILAALELKKFFYDAAGERVDSYSKAHFILTKTQRVYVDPETGKPYLLATSNNLDSEGIKNLFNTLSSQDKLAAQQRFEESRPEILSLKIRVLSDKEAELNMHAEKKQMALTRSELLQQELLDLTNEAAMLDSFMEQLNEINPNAHPPVPRPTPMPSSPTKSVFKAQVYRHVLGLINFNPTATAIERFAHSFPSKKEQDLIKNTLIPGNPISQPTIDSLLQNLNRFAVSSNKPEVTSIPDKTPNKVTTPASPSATAPTLTPKDPFKTRPF